GSTFGVGAVVMGHLAQASGVAPLAFFTNANTDTAGFGDKDSARGVTPVTTHHMRFVVRCMNHQWLVGDEPGIAIVANGATGQFNELIQIRIVLGWWWCDFPDTQAGGHPINCPSGHRIVIAGVVGPFTRAVVKRYA